MRVRFGAALAVLATSTALGQQPPRIERIEVTGSHIPRTDIETVAPVEIITREQIERSGYPTAAELLRHIPANTGGSFNEVFFSGFAPGSSGVSLRGLGQRATLVLLDGRRVTGYGFAQNLQDAFVDLNSIGTNAIERIEILKDGASAIYGSDAIAGVVNIILRKGYQGVEASAHAGSFDGRKDLRLALTAGAGDLARDGYSAFGTFDFYKRDLLTLAQSRFSGAARDFRGEQGGRNLRYDLRDGGTWRQLSPSNATTNVHRAITDCPGLVLTTDQAVDLGLIDAIFDTARFNLPGNTFCALDSAEQFPMLPKTQRIGFLGRISRAISASAVAYLDLGLNRVTTANNSPAATFAGAGMLETTAAGLRRTPFNVNFAPGVAGNPFPVNARYVGRLHDLGTRDSEVISDTARVLAGIDYRAGPWDFDSALGWSRNEVAVDNFNRLSRAGIEAVFNVPTTPQPPAPVPLSTQSSYNLDRFTSNSEAVRAQLIANLTARVATSELAFVDTRASRELGALPGGPVGLAVGAEYRWQGLIDEFSGQGGLLGQGGTTATDGKRDSGAVFAEVSLPFSRNVEGQLAGRYDHYSDYGSAFTPKAGVKVKALPSLLLRATWGRGFRAPNLHEISPSTSLFTQQIVNPETGGAQIIYGVLAGNPQLAAEKSTSITIGGVWEPRRDASVGLNFYDIKWENRISGDCCQAILDSRDPARVIRDADNNIVGVVTRWENADDTRTYGLDFDMRYRITTTTGRWSASTNASYVASWKVDGVEFAGTNRGGGSIPRMRAQASLDWDLGAASATIRYNYIAGMKQILVPANWFQQQDPRVQNDVLPRRTGSYATWDVYGAYRLATQVKISGSIINVFNKRPPFDPGWGGFDFSQYDVRRTQYRVGLEWKM